MNKGTLAALRESIQHWKRLATGKSRSDEEIGASHCALCDRFNSRINPFHCEGCPIRDHTGYRYCANTPYTQARKAFKAGKDSLVFKAAALEELKFLRSLLP